MWSVFSTGIAGTKHFRVVAALVGRRIMSSWQNAWVQKLWLR